MNRSAVRAHPTLWIWPLAVVAAGCAGLKLPKPPVPDITEERQQRSKQASREFDRSRDFAEFQAALSRWSQDDVKGCEEQLRRLLARNADHRDARLLLADVCRTTSRTGEAFDQAERALQAHPHDAKVQHAFGLLLEATGQGTGALAYYQRAATWEPNNEIYVAAYRTALATAGQSGRPAEGPDPRRSNPSGAPPVPIAHAPDPTAEHASMLAPPVKSSLAKLATATVDVSPSAPLSPPFASNVLAAHYADPADSRDSVRFAGTTAQDTAAGLVERGRAALAKGSAETALAYFRRAAAEGPDNPQIPIAAAVASLQHNQPDLAIRLLRPLEDRFGNSAALRRVLGVAYYRLGDYQSSQAALRQALSLDKSNPLSYFLMGCTLAKLGQFESAEAHLRQARTIDPRYTIRR